MDLQITIEENSPRWVAVQRVAESNHISPEQAAEQVFDAGIRDQSHSFSIGNIWGIAGNDVEVLDAIVADAIAERRSRFTRRLDA